VGALLSVRVAGAPTPLARVACCHLQQRRSSRYHALMRVMRTMLAIAGLLGGPACSGGGSGGDTGATDAGVADGGTSLTCDKTTCGQACVDTAADRAHCGACDNACSPAQECSGQCSCPALMVAASPGGLYVDDEKAAPLLLALSMFSADGGSHAVAVGYHPIDSPLATDIDLSSSGEFVALAYKVNLLAGTATASFRAASGTLRFSKRCTGGAAGTITAAHFVELDSSEPPQVIAGGCTYDAPAITFQVGNCN
jgi:hypothetical protein